MPIPFRDADEIEELGAVAYLKVVTVENKGTYRGALFLVNARGEPLEFTYNSIETPNTYLWRKEDIRRHATRRLTTSLFSTCQKIPQFIICLADEIDHTLFCNEIHLSIPVCRVAFISAATPHSPSEAQTTIEDPQPLHLFWFPGKPADESTEHRLLNRLITSGLLLEPFERAMVGIREVYSPSTA